MTISVAPPTPLRSPVCRAAPRSLRQLSSTAPNCFAKAADVELPELPAVPQAVLDNTRELPELLIDSDDDFRTQCEKLIASKAYREL